VVPRRVQADRREHGGPIAAPVGEPGLELADRVRLVEAEYLARGVGTVAKTVPDLALGGLVPAQQDLLGVAFIGSGEQHYDGLGFGKSAQIIEMAVRPVRVMR